MDTKTRRPLCEKDGCSRPSIGWVPLEGLRCANHAFSDEDLKIRMAEMEMDDEEAPC